jgi:hypothetical protein
MDLLHNYKKYVDAPVITWALAIAIPFTINPSTRDQSIFVGPLLGGLFLAVFLGLNTWAHIEHTRNRQYILAAITSWLPATYAILMFGYNLVRFYVIA